MASTLLSGSHSVNLVPYPQCSVLESGGVDNLAAQVSHHHLGAHVGHVSIVSGEAC